MYKFDPLKLELYNKNKNITALPDARIGSFDMEVYIEGSKSMIYALGFHSYLGETKMFYINKNLESDKNLINCLNVMFEYKYSGITWYCHNSGRYDSRILLKVLYEYNNSVKERNRRILDYNDSVKKHNMLVIEYNNIIKDNEFSDYKEIEEISVKDYDNSLILDIKTTFRKSTILKLEVSKIVNKTKYTITICDSCALFPDSLKRLAEKYNVSTLKGDFPHEFANSKTVFYIGNTPDLSYYENTNIEDYSSLYSTNWDFKEESIKYLTKDLVSLYEILVTSNRSLHSHFNVQIVNCLTVYRIASDIYLKNFVNRGTSNLPYINIMSVFNDIHKAYFGGITEVYIPYGINLKYYDVNSLYPYASYNPMPGLNAEYIDYFDKSI